MGTSRVEMHSDHPTIDAPASGFVSTVVDGQEIPLAEADYWIQEDSFVVRSREFDCFAEGADLDAALTAFGREVYGYAEVLQRRYEAGEATDSERQTLTVLSRRLSRVYLAERRQLSQPRRLFGVRRIRRQVREGRHQISAAGTTE